MYIRNECKFFAPIPVVITIPLLIKSATSCKTMILNLVEKKTDSMCIREKNVCESKDTNLAINSEIEDSGRKRDCKHSYTYAYTYPKKSF